MRYAQLFGLAWHMSDYGCRQAGSGASHLLCTSKALLMLADKSGKVASYGPEVGNI